MSVLDNDLPRTGVATDMATTDEDMTLSPLHTLSLSLFSFFLSKMELFSLSLSSSSSFKSYSKILFKNKRKEKSKEFPFRYTFITTEPCSVIPLFTPRQNSQGAFHHVCDFYSEASGTSHMIPWKRLRYTTVTSLQRRTEKEKREWGVNGGEANAISKIDFARKRKTKGNIKRSKKVGNKKIKYKNCSITAVLLRQHLLLWGKAFSCWWTRKVVYGNLRRRLILSQTV